MRSIMKSFLRAHCYALAGAIVLMTCVAPAEAAAPKPRFTEPTAFDVSKPLRSMRVPARPMLGTEDGGPIEVRREANVRPRVQDNGYTGDGALDRSVRSRSAKSGVIASMAISAPLANFEGLSATRTTSTSSGAA